MSDSVVSDSVSSAAESDATGGKSVTYDQSGTMRLPDAPDRSHMPVWANERTPTPAGSSPLAMGLSGPHPTLASEDAARRAMLDHQYRNANGETTSRIVLVGVIEEGSRSLQSMDHWLCQSASHLRAAGCSTAELRRVRNAILALIPNWHAIGETIATQRRR